MISKKELATEIDYLASLKTIMETFEEIAASRIQKIRSSVLGSRDFLMEVNSVFQQVKYSYKNEVNKLLKQKKINKAKQMSFINHNGKNLFAVVCSNTGFYGDIVRRTFNLFAKEFKKAIANKNKNDAVIIGRVGLQFFQEEFSSTPFTYFDFPDDKTDEEAFKNIIAHLIQYESVIVFYARFQNIITQEPTGTSISGDRLDLDNQPKEGVKYFFEPSLENIMGFFEKQIFASIFEQTMLESRLAKFASRMVTLDSAADNTKSRLKQMLFVRERIRHSAMNKKQMEALSSHILWQ